MSNHTPQRPCARCGILRRGRIDTLCTDCRLTCSAEEKASWVAQIRADLAHQRKVAA